MPGTHANNENTDVITVTNHQLPDNRYKLKIYKSQAEAEDKNM